MAARKSIYLCVNRFYWWLAVWSTNWYPGVCESCRLLAIQETRWSQIYHSVAVAYRTFAPNGYAQVWAILIGAAVVAVVALGLAGGSRVLDQLLAATTALAGRLRHGVRVFDVVWDGGCGGMGMVVKVGSGDCVLLLVVLIVCWWEWWVEEEVDEIGGEVWGYFMVEIGKIVLRVFCECIVVPGQLISSDSLESLCSLWMFSYLMLSVGQWNRFKAVCLGQQRSECATQVVCIVHSHKQQTFTFTIFQRN